MFVFDAPNWIVPSKGVLTFYFSICEVRFSRIFAARKIIQFQILNPPKAQSPPGDRFGPSGGLGIWASGSFAASFNHRRWRIARGSKIEPWGAANRRLDRHLHLG
jgi:hypothetical protein